jgi:hypothetical protein
VAGEFQRFANYAELLSACRDDERKRIVVLGLQRRLSGFDRREGCHGLDQAIDLGLTPGVTAVELDPLDAGALVLAGDNHLLAAGQPDDEVVVDPRQADLARPNARGANGVDVAVTTRRFEDDVAAPADREDVGVADYVLPPRARIVGRIRRRAVA